MADQEALPIVAEAGARIKGSTLQIHCQLCCKCCTSAFCGNPRGTCTTAQPGLHNEVYDSTLPLVVILVMGQFYAQAQR